MVSEQYQFGMTSDPSSSSTPATTSSSTPATTSSSIPATFPSANPTTISNIFSPQSLSFRSQSDSILPINIPVSIKLNHTNYLTWKAQILPLIHGYNLTNFLTSTSPNPTIQNSAGVIEFNPEYLPWNRQDQLLLGWMRSSLGESIQAQVISCSTTASLWQTLQQQFSSTSRAKLIDLKRQLQTVTKNSTSCTDFLHQIRRIFDELAFIGAPMSDDDLVLTTLNGLGPDFNSFVAAVTATSRHDPLSFSDLHGMFLSHEALLKSQHTTNTVSLPSAFYSNNGPNRNHNQNQRFKNTNFRPPITNNNSQRLPLPPPAQASSITSQNSAQQRPTNSQSVNQSVPTNTQN